MTPTTVQLPITYDTRDGRLYRLAKMLGGKIGGVSFAAELALSNAERLALLPDPAYRPSRRPAYAGGGQLQVKVRLENGHAATRPIDLAALLDAGLGEYFGRLREWDEAGESVEGRASVHGDQTLRDVCRQAVAAGRDPRDLFGEFFAAAVRDLFARAPLRLALPAEQAMVEVDFRASRETLDRYEKLAEACEDLELDPATLVRCRVARSVEEAREP